MRNRSVYFAQHLFILVLLSLPFTGMSQELMKGILVDSASFDPLPHVSVRIKNASRGTTSDINGNFSILASREDTLVFTLIGYERLEYPLVDYEASVIRMTEKGTLLNTVTITDSRLYENPYEHMFDEQQRELTKKIPFYYSRARRDKIKAGRWRNETMRVQTYVDVVILNPATKNDLVTRFALSEKEYYDTLAAFNEKHYAVMYYLTAGELLSLLNNFFASRAVRK